MGSLQDAGGAVRQNCSRIVADSQLGRQNDIHGDRQTLSAAALYTFSLGQEVVLVASAASIAEGLAAHGGGVIEVALQDPKARPAIRLQHTRL